MYQIVLIDRNGNADAYAANTAAFADRLTVNPVAVGLADGPVTFGWEETGRYGGIGLALKDGYRERVKDGTGACRVCSL